MASLLWWGADTPLLSSSQTGPGGAQGGTADSGWRFDGFGGVLGNCFQIEYGFTPQFWPFLSSYLAL